ncbi:arylamine N-acetyltransferase [Congregibacter variabilis]|uniref:Arylamine N-acetyltransferase n=1 Tax=Congregibacter variabilis TaxID=3081200 RepID=A0ABZ0I692_9GAMM|nr:arylamine N-acetyltransferase [Congregibacter sp. IMCC43200]
MELDAYLHRINFVGTPKPDLDTLFQLQRQHLYSIPYSNLDVQLGRPLTTDVKSSYVKLVEQRQGGWCYEMNGLLGAMLESVGFQVMRMSGGVRRDARGDSAIGNHLVLCVQLDEPWVVDVGLGDGPYEPYPLKAHTFSQRGFTFRLEHVNGYWRLHNYAGSTAPTFDFVHQTADEGQLSAKCHWLSTEAESPFVNALVYQRVVPDGYDLQVGRVATTVRPGVREERLIDSADEFVRAIYHRFGIDEPALESLWETVLEQHEIYLASKEKQ